jgi:hypothetical protein
LASYVVENRIPHLRLAYFGADNPWAYLDDKRLEFIPPPWNDEFVKGRTHIELKSGYYAISATLLSGQFFQPKYRDYYAPFRNLTPCAKAGYSIFIYRIP